MWNKFTNKQTPSSVFEWSCFLDPAFVIGKNNEILNEMSSKKQNKMEQNNQLNKNKNKNQNHHHHYQQQ